MTTSTSPARPRYVKVAVNAGRPTRLTFSYSVPAGRSVVAGEVVHVPWGQRTLQGVVVQVMDTPGYDPVSATGQVAGGANLICFTTGRGSAYGCAPAPSLKLSTNNALFLKQKDDIDINCGDIIEGRIGIDALGQQIFEHMLACASGQASKSELHGYGQNEFVPWQVGAVM